MATTLQGKTNTEDIFAEHMSGHYRWTPTASTNTAACIRPADETAAIDGPT